MYLTTRQPGDVKLIERQITYTIYVRKIKSWVQSPCRKNVKVHVLCDCRSLILNHGPLQKRNVTVLALVSVIDNFFIGGTLQKFCSY